MSKKPFENEIVLRFFNIIVTTKPLPMTLAVPATAFTLVTTIDKVSGPSCGMTNVSCVVLFFIVACVPTNK